ncbi:type II toxin-antitoxin system ParD family antitoxin [Rhizobium sp. DKSPLA3]|uniref:Type II toxin-antitoxin system ParD family antitoxin n=1 Tax=Rhizobium quercicola TaxID=2901226 RepID=A0A9X1NTB3_9HYPH|nr:type II toxin-antitoxin system ParD family antitoxin [Rhizobium quercicola]MCD7108981.1 type II toxin-antitoxin system ParD family antitoxin [Rhizobium quercicola]
MTDIHLSDDDRTFTEEQLQMGAYRTADDVIRAGLQVLREEDEELRRLIKVGEDDIEAGRYVTFEKAGDLKKHILALARERQNARSAPEHEPSRAQGPSGHL